MCLAIYNICQKTYKTWQTIVDAAGVLPISNTISTCCWCGTPDCGTLISHAHVIPHTINILVATSNVQCYQGMIRSSTSYNMNSMQTLLNHNFPIIQTHMFSPSTNAIRLSRVKQLCGVQSKYFNHKINLIMNTGSPLLCMLILDHG